jgi:hypothetical protein
MSYSVNVILMCGGFISLEVLQVCKIDFKAISLDVDEMTLPNSS